MMSPPTRRFLSATLAVVAAAITFGIPAAGLAQAARDPGAEAYVAAGAQRVISVLSDRRLTEAQKVDVFHKVIDELADVPKITNFVLGKYARTITPEQRARFAPAFRTYAEGVYRNRLNEYRGEKLQVIGSTVRKPGDVIVKTQIVGGRQTQPVLVSWRVLGGPGAWKVVDVQLKGVWLAITQQQDFVSTIDNAGGNIDVLIAQLQRDAQRPAR